MKIKSTGAVFSRVRCNTPEVIGWVIDHCPRLGELISDMSQKMLTKTLRQMEADGLVLRTVFPVVPPRVEYELTPLGQNLGTEFCGVWTWAEEHRQTIMDARAAFSALKNSADTPN